MHIAAPLPLDDSLGDRLVQLMEEQVVMTSARFLAPLIDGEIPESVHFP